MLKMFFRRTATPFFLALALTIAPLSDALADGIGKVDKITGTVTLVDGSGQTRALNVGDSLSEGDAVTTGADGEVLFRMVDDGAIALRPNTQLRFTNYKFESRPTDSSLLNLLKGSVRSLTGLIGKTNPDRASIRTPSATIGIRGTDHEVLLLTEDSPDGAAGTYDRVFEGSTYIEAENGQRLDVSTTQVGYTPQDVLAVAAQLRLLPNVPPFFKTGKFDDLFALLADVLKKRLQDKLRSKLPGPLQGIVNLPGLGDLFKK